MMKQSRIQVALVLSGLLLAGCSALDNATGKTKKSPDEFQVVVRPPLTLPPSFSLEPVDKEEQVTVSTDAVSVIDQVITKSSRTEVQSFDALFGTDQIEPDIRTKVDEETLGIQIDRRVPFEVLFGGQPNVGPNLNSEAEALRIRNAIQNGDNVTASPTPATDPVDNTILTIE